MKYATFITSLPVSAPDGDADIAVYHDPGSGGIFGLDASFVDQVGAVVMNPMQSQPEFLLLAEGGDGEVDREALAEFVEQMGSHPIIQALSVLAAVGEMDRAAGADGEGEWIGTALYRRIENDCGINRAQLGVLTGLASQWLSDLKSGITS